MSAQAILLPGAVLPADLAYSSLLAALGPDVEALAKELELYAGDRPPPGYSLDTEIDGILRVADEAGFGRFHLVGYSAGGAASLAFAAAQHRERLASLALLEPAWSGRDRLDPEEAAVRDELDRAISLPEREVMPAFVRLQLAPGVAPPPPPPGDPPAWMAKRPPGLRALAETFATYDLDGERLRGFARPVLYVLGGRSNPDLYGRQCRRLEALFPDFRTDVFAERHHFDPPHRAEPERLAATLRRLWGLAPS